MSQVHHEPPDDRWGPAQPASPRDEQGGYPGPYTGVPHGSAPPPRSPQQGSPTPTSAVVLLVLGGLGLLAFVWTGLGLVWAAPVVLAVLAVVARDDVPRSRRLTRIGWIVYAVLAALTVLLISLAVAAFIAFVSAGPGVDGGSYEPGTIALTASALGAP